MISTTVQQIEAVGSFRFVAKKMKDVLVPSLLWQGAPTASAVLSNAMSMRCHTTDLEKMGLVDNL